MSLSLANKQSCQSEQCLCLLSALSSYLPASQPWNLWPPSYIGMSERPGPPSFSALFWLWCNPRETPKVYGWCFWCRGERTLDLSWHCLLSRRGTNTRKTEVSVGLWYYLPSLLGTQPHFLGTHFSENVAHLQPICCLHTQMDISFRLALHCNCLPQSQTSRAAPQKPANEGQPSSLSAHIDFGDCDSSVHILLSVTLF